MVANVSIVVSHYEKRDKEDLNKLLDQLHLFKKQVVVVINRDGIFKENYFRSDEVLFIERPNLGMNIGGWSAAIKYCDKSDYVIFLQDECEILSFDFLEKYAGLLDQKQNGMVGESINPKWVFEWRILQASPINYVLPGSEKPITRIDYYHQCFRNWNIQPGDTGNHLRALTWGLKTSFLQKLEKFPIGGNKEECIASEIGVSKLVEQHGLRIIQSSEQPFHFVRHKEWHHDGWSKKNKC
jgi:hypothetical protein